jgi:hypothetical protein
VFAASFLPALGVFMIVMGSIKQIQPIYIACGCMVVAISILFWVMQHFFLRPAEVPPTPAPFYGVGEVHARAMPTSTEYNQANVYLTGHDPSSKKRFGRSVLGWLIFLGATIAIFAYFHDKGQSAPASMPATAPVDSAANMWRLLEMAAGIGGTFVGLGLTFVGAAWRLNRPRGVVLGWTDEGLVDAAEGVTIVSKWSVFRDFLDTPESYLLRIDTTHAIVVPKRSFADVPARLQFLEILLRHLPQGTSAR